MPDFTATFGDLADLKLVVKSLIREARSAGFKAEDVWTDGPLTARLSIDTLSDGSPVCNLTID